MSLYLNIFLNLNGTLYQVHKKVSGIHTNLYRCNIGYLNIDLRTSTPIGR